MRKRHVAEELLAYVNGNLDGATRRAVEEHLAGCAECRKEHEALHAAWIALGELPGASPYPSMERRFQAMLSAYELGMETAGGPGRSMRNDTLFERLFLGRPAVQIGFACAILLFGLLGGYAVTGGSRDSQEMTLLRDEVHGLRNLLAVSMLQQESASERLKGVSWSSQTDGGDPDILAALVNTMNHDSNINVRLAALNALSRDMDNPEVRRALLQTFPRQSSPMMQLALVNLLVQINSEESHQVLEQALQKPHLQPDVQKRIKQSIRLFL